MASTEAAAAARDPAIRVLSRADLPACLELSRTAGWNQNQADWQLMLARGQGWGLDGDSVQEHESGQVLAASAVVIPYRFLPGAAALAAASGCAWVSMVLVLPPFRRRGLATRLLRHAIHYLLAEGLLPVLDATPAGYPVYLKQGFLPAWGFRRYRREAAAREPVTGIAPRTRAITDRDWPAIVVLDAAAFGADRSGILRALAARMPQAARLAEQGGRITGFSFARDGRDACQLGPLVAQDSGTAEALMDDALQAISTPVLVDLAESHLGLLPWLVARGFVLQRPFTRMVLGALPAPGNPARLVLMAGPEFG